MRVPAIGFVQEAGFRYGNELLLFAVACWLQVLLAVYGRYVSLEAAQQATGPSYLLLGALTVAFWWKSEPGRRVSRLGLRIGEGLGADLLIGLGLLAVYYGLAVGLPWALGAIAIEVNPNGLQYSRSVEGGPGPAAVGLVLVISMAAVNMVNKTLGEELFFRGYLFGSMAEKSGIARATVWNGLLFGLWHVPFLLVVQPVENAFALFVNVFWLCLGTVPVCIVFAGTRSLYGISLYHALANLKHQVLLCAAETAGNGATGQSLFQYRIVKSHWIVPAMVLAMLGQIAFAAWVYVRLRKRSALGRAVL